MKRKICILGSTGSIGTQALQVIEEHADLFEAYVLTAGSNSRLLIEQARKFLPCAVVIADESKYDEVKEALADQPIQVYAGDEALCQVVTMEPVDMVLTALVGFSGLKPTISAIKAGKPIALANKETLVVAGELITALCQEYNVPMLPVDSEHSAIFQSLMGEESPIEKIILTASGGPFRKFTLDEMRNVTAAQALKHPNWDMRHQASRSTTSSQRGVPRSRRSAAQLGAPDMRVPIQLAMSYPVRLESSFPRIDWWDMQDLTFERPDMERFPCLAMAYEALRRGGNTACVVNAANEVVNLAFRQDRCGFLQMAEVIQETLARVPYIKTPSLEDYLETDRVARKVASELL